MYVNYLKFHCTKHTLTYTHTHIHTLTHTYTHTRGGHLPQAQARSQLPPPVQWHLPLPPWIFPAKRAAMNAILAKLLFQIRLLHAAPTCLRHQVCIFWALLLVSFRTYRSLLMYLAYLSYAWRQVCLSGGSVLSFFVWNSFVGLDFWVSFDVWIGLFW